jgi:hypothetical protein
MLQYLKTLIQLILSPKAGWEDISAEGTDPELMIKSGLYPLIGISACSEFLRLFYDNSLTLITAIEMAVINFGSLFASVYIAKLVFEIYISRFVQGEMNVKKNMTFITVIIGIVTLLQIITNCFPAGLTILKFVPIYIMMIIYKSLAYMAVKQETEVHFVLLATAVTIVVPQIIYYLLSCIIV